MRSLPPPRFTHLDDWVVVLMRAKRPEGKPVVTESDVGSNFGWYQGVTGQLAAHVAARTETEALSQFRRMMSGDASPTMAEIVEELEVVAPGARAVLDSLGAGYGSRDK